MSKTVIITGANSGLGFETAKQIAQRLKQFKDILAKATDSARLLTDLMCVPQLADGPAKYYDRRSDNPIASFKLSYDENVAKELSDYSMTAAGLTK